MEIAKTAIGIGRCVIDFIAENRPFLKWNLDRRLITISITIQEKEPVHSINLSIDQGKQNRSFLSMIAFSKQIK